jgi:hypothetical protein
MHPRSPIAFHRDRVVLTALALVVWAASLAAEGADDDGMLANFTRAQLNAAIQQTKNQSTRLEGLRQLIRMAGQRLYEGSLVMGDPNPEMFKMRGEAAVAAEGCRDVATVGAALDSRYSSVRTWAVLNFEKRPEFQEPWLPLLPKLVKMLSGPDPGFRQLAVDALRFYPEGHRAILEREPLETDPNVLLRIAGSGSSPAFYRSLIRLLSSDDAAIRGSALSFICFNLSNQSTAEMWRLGFNQGVRERVLALSVSTLPEERTSALKALQLLDQKAAREPNQQTE